MKDCNTCEALDAIRNRRDGVTNYVYANAHCEVVHETTCDEACVCADGRHYIERDDCQCLDCIDMRDRIVCAHDEAEDAAERDASATCAICDRTHCGCDEAYQRMCDERLEAER